MKPFNLEEAKAGKPVITMAGRPARVLCFDAKIFDTTPLYVLVEDENHREFAIMATLNGETCHSGNKLYMKTEKKTGWVNIYRISSVGDGRECHKIYKTKEEAIYAARQDAYLITTIKIEWEE